jgi:hypothetical protein
MLITGVEEWDAVKASNLRSVFIGAISASPAESPRRRDRQCSIGILEGFNHFGKNPQKSAVSYTYCHGR